VRRRGYTYADGFKLRRRREQPAECKSVRGEDFRARRWQESSPGREEGRAPRSSGSQQAGYLAGPSDRAFEEGSNKARRGGGAPQAGEEALVGDEIRVGEAWSEILAEEREEPQGQAGAGATQEERQRPGERKANRV